MIGDLVIAGLKDIDQVAYIRYAIVYLGLADVESVRREIDRIRALTAVPGALLCFSSPGDGCVYSFSPFTMC
jgi:hypothetical protein